MTTPQTVMIVLMTLSISGAMALDHKEHDDWSHSNGTAIIRALTHALIMCWRGFWS